MSSGAAPAPPSASAAICSPMFLEFREPFSRLDDWKSWVDLLPQLRDPTYIQDVARSVASSGFIDPFFGAVSAHDVAIEHTNYREGLLARGSTSRYRAILTHVVDYVLANGRCSPIYLSEHITMFAQTIAEHFPYVVTSEYLPNAAARRRHPDIRHEDPAKLSLPDKSFDLYISSDTMVYAPSMEEFLREARRVLRRSGLLLATFPFRYGEQASEIKVKMVDGRIVHTGEPVYHGDPLDHERQRLVFFIPGWDILDQARAAGFQNAEIIAHSSRTNAIIGAEIATVFVLKAMA